VPALCERLGGRVRGLFSGRRAYVSATLAVLALDQIVKLVVERSLPLHESLPIVPGLLQLTRVHNRGAAFGLFSEADLPFQSQLFAFVSILALGAIVIYAWRLSSERHLPQIAVALVIGGALGNLTDRIVRGYVIDFIDVYWRIHHWPMFNVADSAISVGVALLILDMLLEPGEPASDTKATP